MNINETIRKRKSCRTYNPVFLSPGDKEELEIFISQNSKGLDNENVDFNIIERSGAESQLKINYGMIQGHHTFVLGTSKSTASSRLNYGYLLEKIVLKATAMNISTCWVGYFDQTYFKEIVLENGFEIPSILIVGYAKDKQSVGERLIRYTIKAHKREDWEQLFFNYNTNLPLDSGQTPEYNDSLEMVRLAPSSGNTQPWRIYFDETTNEFHFFKKTINKRYEEMGLHDIDMGIALAHFELSSLDKRLTGSWIKYPKATLNSIEGLHYSITWKCE